MCHKTYLFLALPPSNTYTTDSSIFSVAVKVLTEILERAIIHDSPITIRLIGWLLIFSLEWNKKNSFNLFLFIVSIGKSHWREFCFNRIKWDNRNYWAHTLKHQRFFNTQSSHCVFTCWLINWVISFIGQCFLVVAEYWDAVCCEHLDGLRCHTSAYWFHVHCFYFVFSLCNSNVIYDAVQMNRQSTLWLMHS